VFVPKFALEGSVSLSEIISSKDTIVDHDESSFHLKLKSRDGNNLFQFQVFQQVKVVISVSELPSGHRELRMCLAAEEEEKTLNIDDECFTESIDAYDRRKDLLVIPESTEQGKRVDVVKICESPKITLKCLYSRNRKRKSLYKFKYQLYSDNNTLFPKRKKET
jgi:hypothetical protein